MSITVEIPTPLRRFTADRGEVQLDDVANVEAALGRVTETFPELKRHLYKDDGKLRSFVNVFLNEDNVRFLDGPSTAVKDGDTLSIIPSIAGGTA